jgi:hypothetical protein
MNPKIDANTSGAGSPPADTAASRAEASRHQEWLLDEALKETFPASDPISPASPGRSRRPEVRFPATSTP